MAAKKAPAFRYSWSAPGDMNAYFAFLLDCVVNLLVLSAILIGVGFPKEIVLTKIIPGGATAIVLGNIAYVWLAFHTAKKTNNPTITAVPVGLDITTILGFSFGVLLPVFFVAKGQGSSAEEAATMAWYVGMAGTIWMAVVKLVASFFGGAIRRFVPPAALIGSIFGIALVWLGANAIFGVMEVPTAGLVSFGIMMFALIAAHKLPWGIPGAVAGLLLGTIVYYILGYAGFFDLLGFSFSSPVIENTGVKFPVLTFHGIDEMFGMALTYLPLTIPFGVLVAASAINITEALKMTGDDYHTESVIRADAAATAIGALFGSVIQTTPYFGHLTYKRMGARSAYAVGVGVTIFITSTFGIIGMIDSVLPSAVAKPILIVVAFDIVRLAFENLPSRHAPAVAVATLPGMLTYAEFKVGELLREVQNGATKLAVSIEQLIPQFWVDQYVLLLALSRGYIVTSLLWAATMAFIIDYQLKRAAAMMLLAAFFTLIGFIHSLAPQGEVYLPWMIAESVNQDLLPKAAVIPYDFALGYFIMAMLFFALSMRKDPTANQSGL